jgi:tetratricopeptide (TPR) repeat protein
LILAIAAFGSGLVLQAIELREQRNLAVVERDRALQVVEILESAFRNADPGQSAGDKVTARQILDAAVPGIERLEQSNPPLFVRMSATLAKVEMDLAQNARAIGWVRRGIAANDISASGDEQPLRDLLTTGSMLLARSGDVGEADSYLERLRSIGSSGTAEYQLAYARNLILKGERRKALELLIGVEQLMGEKADDANYLRASEVRWLKASCLRTLGRTSEAVALLRATLDWQRSQLSTDHPWLLRTRTHLFSTVADIAPTQELVAEHRGLIQDLLERHGSDSIEVGVNRGSLGATLLKLSRYTESAVEYAEAFRISTTLRGEEHRQTLIVALNYANALSQTKDQDSMRRALAVLEHTSEILKQKTGRNAPIRGRARWQLANVHMDLGNFQDAARVLIDPDEPMFSEVSNSTVQRDLSRAARRLYRAAECPEVGVLRETLCAELNERIELQE